MHGWLIKNAFKNFPVSISCRVLALGIYFFCDWGNWTRAPKDDDDSQCPRACSNMVGSEASPIEEFETNVRILSSLDN